MADVKIYKNVRFANRIDTEANWAMANPTLEPGELAFVGSDENYIMILGDTHKKPIKEILNELSTGKHDTHVFYPGKNSSNNSGGGGGSTSIPIATIDTIGGVKVPTAASSGLNLKRDGTLTNALINRYDSSRECFVIKKLYVENLEYDNKETNPSFEGDTITLRDGETTALSLRAGIVIDSLKKDFDGFLGLSSNNRITIKQLDGTYVEMLGLSAVNNDTVGLVSIVKGASTATIQQCSTLSVVDSGTTATYTPAGNNVTIDVTPPTIKVNGQTTTYDANAREYSIVLDGGLTPENIAKIEQLEQSLDDIATLQRETLVDVKAGNIISVTKNNDRTVTIHHAEVAVGRTDSDSILNYHVEQTSQPEVIYFLTDIDVDEYGHITKKYYKGITWTI
jgi:hypothetical protein